MISYKIGLLPVLPFVLGQFMNGIIAMLEVGIFVLCFMMGSIAFNNYILEPFTNKIRLRKILFSMHLGGKA